MNRYRTKQLAVSALFTVLIIAGAFINIPVPVIPFTMQTAFVTLAALMLGPWWGTACVGIYIFMGLIGIPVFIGGGGFGYVLQPTFGYIIGFLFGAIVMGLIAHSGRFTIWRCMAACMAGIVVIDLIGGVYLYLISNLYLGNAISVNTVVVSYTLMFLGPDLLKALLACLLARKLLPHMYRFVSFDKRFGKGMIIGKKPIDTIAPPAYTEESGEINDKASEEEIAPHDKAGSIAQDDKAKDE